MSSTTIAGVGGISEPSSYLQTPLANVPYPPIASTPVDSYNIPGLTQDIYNGICSLYEEVEFHFGLGLVDYLLFNELEFAHATVAGRQLMLHFYEQHTGEKGIFARDSKHPKIWLGPAAALEGLPIIPIAGYTNLCLEPPQDVLDQISGDIASDNSIFWVGRTTTQTANMKVPRPANEWILYRADNHLGIKNAYPNITNNEISSIIAGVWAAESQDRKAKYKERARLLREAHTLRYPSYKYSPRRPSEKKRRASKKKNIVKTSATKFNNATTFTASSTDNLCGMQHGVNPVIIPMPTTPQMELEASPVSHASLGPQFTPSFAYQSAQQQDLLTFFGH